MAQPLILLDTVALTAERLPLAPRLSALAKAGWQRPLREVWPAVTCTAQATLLTGKTASEHGVVGNGWLFRDTGEVRFWQQSNRLIQAEPLYVTARGRAKTPSQVAIQAEPLDVTARRTRPPFKVAKLFWWFNQGAD